MLYNVTTPKPLRALSDRQLFWGSVRPMGRLSHRYPNVLSKDFDLLAWLADSERPSRMMRSQLSRQIASSEPIQRSVHVVFRRKDPGAFRAAIYASSRTLPRSRIEQLRRARADRHALLSIWSPTMPFGLGQARLNRGSYLYGLVGRPCSSRLSARLLRAGQRSGAWASVMRR